MTYINPEVLPQLFWRCPSCGVQKPLDVEHHTFKPSKLYCSACKSSWEIHKDDMKPVGQNTSLTTIDAWFSEMLQMPITLVPLATHNAILKKGEEAYLEENPAALYKEHTVSARVGASKGVSIRVAKGVWAHVGSSNGHTVSHEAIDVQDHGALTLTNQRLLFSGTAHAVAIQLKNVSGVELSEGLLHVVYGQKVALFGQFQSGTKWEQHIRMAVEQAQI